MSALDSFLPGSTLETSLTAEYKSGVIECQKEAVRRADVAQA